MTKEYWLKRKAGWSFFNQWEREQQRNEYQNMPYAKRFEIFEMLYESATQRNSHLVDPELTVEKLQSHPSFKFRLELAKRKQKLPKVNF